MSKDVQRMSLEETESFTSDQVTSAIKSSRKSRAYGPDSLSIFQLNNIGTLSIDNNNNNNIYLKSNIQCI